LNSNKNIKSFVIIILLLQTISLVAILVLDIYTIYAFMSFIALTFKLFICILVIYTLYKETKIIYPYGYISSIYTVPKTNCVRANFSFAFAAIVVATVDPSLARILNAEVDKEFIVKIAGNLFDLHKEMCYLVETDEAIKIQSLRFESEGRASSIPKSLTPLFEKFQVEFNKSAELSNSISKDVIDRFPSREPLMDKYIGLNNKYQDDLRGMSEKMSDLLNKYKGFK